MNIGSLFQKTMAGVCTFIAMAGIERPACAANESVNENQALASPLNETPSPVETTMSYRLPEDDLTKNCSVVMITSTAQGKTYIVSDPVLTEKKAADIVRANRAFFSSGTSQQAVNCGEISHREWLCLASATEALEGVMTSPQPNRALIIKPGASTAALCQ